MRVEVFENTFFHVFDGLLILGYEIVQNKRRAQPVKRWTVFVYEENKNSSCIV